MKDFVTDFHIHTLLSPCAEVEMTPHHIVMRAAEFGIDAVAITDHNGSANVPAALKAGERYGIKVFPGMEVECVEEAHILALFDTLEQSQQWQKIIDARMSGLQNNAAKLGAQYVVDDDDNFLWEETRMLSAPTRLTAKEVVEQVAVLGGITIAAHIDRPSNSIIGQLGFIEPDFGFSGAEISRAGWNKNLQSGLQRLAGYLPYVTDSDAHNIFDFIEGPKNILHVEELSIAEIKMALACEAGRSIMPGHYLDVDLS